nr:hypothetical protein GCM10020092_066530 [Actinoplanes digitatis]
MKVIGSKLGSVPPFSTLGLFDRVGQGGPGLGEPVHRLTGLRLVLAGATGGARQRQCDAQQQGNDLHDNLLGT